MSPSDSDAAIYRYTASRANGTTQTGWFRWSQRGDRHAEHAVKILMQMRFNRASVTLDGTEVGGIAQDRPRGPRKPWWDATA
jgi:hypothetical protein